MLLMTLDAVFVGERARTGSLEVIGRDDIVGVCNNQVQDHLTSRDLLGREDVYHDVYGQDGSAGRGAGGSTCSGLENSDFNEISQHGRKDILQVGLLCRTKSSLVGATIVGLE